MYISGILYHKLSFVLQKSCTGIYWWNISLLSFFSLIWFPFILCYIWYQLCFPFSVHPDRAHSVRNNSFPRTLQIVYFDRNVKKISLIYMYNTKIYRTHSNNWHIIIYAYVHKNAYIRHKTTQNKQFLFSWKGYH